MRVAMPSIEQIDQLPVLLRYTLPPEWQDLNGHINVQHYVHLYDLAGASMLASIGIDARDAAARGCGWFELEHHLWYLREMHVGDEVTLHWRLLQRGAKRFHGTMFIVNRSRRSLASVLEFLSTAADLEARAAATIPEDVARLIDARIDADRALGWPVPTCGAIAV